MNWSNQGVALAALLAVVGVALMVVVMFRTKRARAQLKRPSVEPADDADRPR
jgi:hypothetical protein